MIFVTKTEHNAGGPNKAQTKCRGSGPPAHIAREFSRLGSRASVLTCGVSAQGLPWVC